MIYKFYETRFGVCAITIGDTGRCYCTEMIDWYHEDKGRKALLSHTKDWGTDLFKDHHPESCKYLGEVVIEDQSSMSENDRDVLKRCIDKEGFDYAMFHYSDYKTVGFNHVEDTKFHKLRDNLLESYNDLENYLRRSGCCD